MCDRKRLRTAGLTGGKQVKHTAGFVVACSFDVGMRLKALPCLNTVTRSLVSEANLAVRLADMLLSTKITECEVFAELTADWGKQFDLAAALWLKSRV